MQISDRFRNFFSRPVTSMFGGGQRRAEIEAAARAPQAVGGQPAGGKKAAKGKKPAGADAQAADTQAAQAAARTGGGEKTKGFLRRGVSALFKGGKKAEGKPRRRPGARALAWGTVGIALLGGTYGVYPYFSQNVDDNLSYQSHFDTQGGSEAVDMMSSLIHREVNENGWVANNPFFMPRSYITLDNMPNYQKGMMTAIALVSLEMRDHIARQRGTSDMDEDLKEAASAIQFDGEMWRFGTESNRGLTSPVESHYRHAMRAMQSYNERLGRGDATLRTANDNLKNLLDRVANDLGAMSEGLNGQVQNDAWFDWGVDDTFYANKGKLYAYYMVLRELGKDFDQTLQDSNARVLYDHMLESLRQAAEMEPVVVLNGKPGRLPVRAGPTKGRGP